MKAVAALARFRAHAETRMGAANNASDAAVLRKTSATAQDDDTGIEAAVWATVHTGPMRLGGAPQGASGATTDSYAEGVEVSRGVRTAHWPHTVDMLRDGDLIEIIAGENAGTVWLIREVDWQDQATARRYKVTATQRPEEWA